MSAAAPQGPEISQTSTISSGTHVPSPPDHEPAAALGSEKKDDGVLHGGEGESAFPEDKKVCVVRSCAHIVHFSMNALAGYADVGGGTGERRR